MKYNNDGKLRPTTENLYERHYVNGPHDRDLRRRQKVDDRNNNRNGPLNSSEHGAPADIITTSAVSTHQFENGSVSNISQSNCSRQSNLTHRSSMPSSNSTPLGFDLDDISINNYTVVNQADTTNDHNIANHTNNSNHSKTSNNFESYGPVSHFSNDNDISTKSRNNLQKKSHSSVVAQYNNVPVKHNPYNNLASKNDFHKGHHNNTNQPKMSETELRNLCDDIDPSIFLDSDADHNNDFDTDIRVVGVNKNSISNPSLPNGNVSTYSGTVRSPPGNKNHNGGSNFQPISMTPKQQSRENMDSLTKTSNENARHRSECVARYNSAYRIVNDEKIRMKRTIMQTYELLGAGMFNEIIINKPSPRYIKYAASAEALSSIIMDMENDNIEIPKRIVTETKKWPVINKSKLSSNQRRLYNQALEDHKKSCEQIKMLEDHLLYRWISFYEHISAGGISNITIEKKSSEYEEILNFMKKRVKSSNIITSMNREYFSNVT